MKRPSTPLTTEPPESHGQPTPCGKFGSGHRIQSTQRCQPDALWHTRSMETETLDAPAVRLPPPVPYLVAVFAGWVLNRFLLTLPFSISPPLRITGATIFILLGLVALASAGVLFKQTGQDPTPWKPATEIISTGIYRFTRNPMYVALALIQIGLAFAMANLWVVALLPPVLGAVQATAILHEEAYLEREFGDAYLDYKRSVRRWL
jgi:protein-S-isoprenylcysteine O-methyltransferase Ste14